MLYFYIFFQGDQEDAVEEVIISFFIFSKDIRIATRSFFFGQMQNYLLHNFQANFQTR